MSGLAMCERLASWKPLWVLVVCSTLLLTSCSIPEDTEGTGPPICNEFVERAGPQQTPDDDRVSDASWKELRGDIETAVRWVDRYWEMHFTECFGRPYEPPEVPDFTGREVPGLFDADSVPECGDHPFKTVDNAYYCRVGHFIGWGDEFMKRGEYAGDGWVYTVVAHEWGHAIQGRMPKEYLSEKRELQADCLGSAAIHGANRETAFEWQPGDPREAAYAFLLIGDDKEWEAEDDHGDPLERTWAFQEGRQAGVDGLNACFRIAWNPNR